MLPEPGPDFVANQICLQPSGVYLLMSPMTSEQLLGQEEPQIQLGQRVASGFQLGTPESWVLFLLAPPTCSAKRW